MAQAMVCTAETVLHILFKLNLYSSSQINRKLLNLNFRSCLARFDIELDLSYSKIACSKVSFLQDQSYNQGYTMSYGGGYDNMQQGYDYSAGYQSAAAPASSKLN